jgi:hypothetical protein
MSPYLAAATFGARIAPASRAARPPNAKGMVLSNLRLFLLREAVQT